jgi:hypothetical protein
MANHRKKGGASSKFSKSPAQDKTVPPASPRVTGPQLWLFRLLALVAAPVFFFGLTELVLRLAGFGYPTEFLLSALQNGQKTFVQNNQFGWRSSDQNCRGCRGRFLFPNPKPTIR